MKELKCCSICKAEKPSSEYHKGKDRYGRAFLQGRCKPCCKVYRKAWAKTPRAKTLLAKKSRQDNLKRYGLSEASYDHLLKQQGGGCAICGEMRTSANKARLSIDHDHETNEIRGLLCHACNVAIGLFKDDIALLYRAIRYLSKTEEAEAA